MAIEGKNMELFLVLVDIFEGCRSRTLACTLNIGTDTMDGMVWVLLHHSIAIVIYTSVFKWV